MVRWRPCWPIWTCVPYSSLERVVEENKDGYYRALRSSQRHIRTDREDLGDWIRFFLTILKQQKDVLLRKTELEKRLGTLPADAERIVSLTRKRGHLSIAEVVDLLGINRNTAKVHLRNLVDEGWLTRQGVSRATRYTVGR